jgi:Abnormal spindle-like microcephaly-assoc'd, ASPM-SPD-2-Hydin/PQQ-like domain
LGETETVRKPVRWFTDRLGRLPAASVAKGRHRRRPGNRRILRGAIAAGMVATTMYALPLMIDSLAHADVVTAGFDNLRTGWDSSEKDLYPTTVTGSNFGQLFATSVEGQVYAQPLVVGDTVIVNTEDDYVYGLDATTGAIKWRDNFGPAWPASTVGCADLTPNLGSTSTAVYDPTTNAVYLTTKVNNGADATSPSWYLHSVDASTGVERSGWPTRITGTPSNDPDRPFNAETVNQRPGLLLMNGVVYLAFGSQCDYGTYVGLVAGVNVTTHAINMWATEAGASNTKAGIWQGGGGLVSDGSGRIFLSTGNGVTAPNGPGSSPPKQLSQSVVRLGVDSTGIMSAKDFFSPSNAAILDQNDQDLGSGGPVALPDRYFGTPAVPHLMVEIGKEGKLVLLNRDNLGGKAQGPGGGDAVVQTVGKYRGVWGHPAAYGGEGGYVYLTQNQGTMLAFKYGTDGAGNPALSLAGNTAETFGYTSGSPIVTSDGTAPGSAVVWVVNVDGPTGSNGRLCAYAAAPVNGQLALLRCFPIGTGVKFASPTAASGRVYIGTRDGKVYGFGQPVTAALNTPQTTFGNVAVGQTGTAVVTVTAVRAVTVNSVSTNTPFAVGQNPPSLPVTLQPGQTLGVPVTFSPTAPGSITGALTFSITDSGSSELLGASLQGNATKPGFTGSPATLDFGEVPIGSTKSLTASFTNTGTADETVTAVTGPGAPYTATGLPAQGAVISPGQSVAVSVTYTPTAAQTDSSSIVITGPDGSGTVTLTGQAVTGYAELSMTPASLGFGSVPVGMTATRTLTVSNTGNLNVTITKAAPPALPYIVSTPLPEGQVLAPDESVQVDVTFAPNATGTFNSLYVITADDGSGPHNVSVSGTAVTSGGGTPLPSVVGGGWVFNGSATMSGTDLVLTPATTNQRGSAVFSTPLPSSGLNASFTAAISGGTGADGMTFAMLDAATATPQSLGNGGGALGFGGLKGVAVTLDTYKGGNDPSSNFIGLTTGLTNGSLTYVATATNIPSLRSGTHKIIVGSSGGTVTVSIDGTQVISKAVALPSNVLLAFTGATGGATDRHVVSNASLTSNGTALPRPGGGWRFNGSAAMNGAQVVLTPAVAQQAGSVFYSDPVNTNGLAASFTLSMNGGTGADGVTFALLDPTKAMATAVGGTGSGLGLAGLAGVAVAFVTYPQNGIDSHNFVGVTTSSAGGPVAFVSSTTNVPNLRIGTHSILINVVGTTITVAVDGTKVLSASVPSLTTTALVGYTAATGGSTDVHAVTNAQVVPGAGVVPTPPAAGWSYNGSAAVSSSGTVTLTTPTANQTGSAIYGAPVGPAHLDAKFTIQIGGGGGADGLAFLILDSTKATSASLGQGGGGLGYSGLSGVAVAFVTYAHTGYPGSNFVGISTAGSGRALTFVSTSTAVPPLRTGTHSVEVLAGSSGDLIVKIDGKQYLDTVVALPSTALIGFSGATGDITDTHAVSGINIKY